MSSQVRLCREPVPVSNSATKQARVSAIEISMIDREKGFPLRARRKSLRSLLRSDLKLSRVGRAGEGNDGGDA
jgi:hypothetical protein